jgi:hypothetical protein
MHAWVHGADAISMWTAVAYHCWWLDRIVCQRRDPRAAGHTCSQWSHLFSREIDDGPRPDAFLAFLSALRCQPGAGLCAGASRHLFSGEVDEDGRSLPCFCFWLSSLPWVANRPRAWHFVLVVVHLCGGSNTGLRWDPVVDLQGAGGSSPSNDFLPLKIL